MFFLCRHPTKAALPAIDALIEALKEEGGVEAMIETRRLESLRVFITHRGR